MDAVTPSRELLASERSLLQQLLDARPVGESALREQLKTARVRAESSGASRSVWLDVDERSPRSKGSPRVPVSGEAPDEDGLPIAVLLHVVDGLVQELEIYRVDGAPIRTNEIPELATVFSPTEEPA
jgi:uncharacterized protein DUF6984